MRTRDIVADFKSMGADNIDFVSDDHPIFRGEKRLFKKENKGRFLTLKLENEKIITNVIALKSKMNIHIYNDDESKTTAKGIQKRQAKKLLTYNRYEMTLQDKLPKESKYIPTYRFTHKDNKISVVKTMKKTLDCYDDKRAILNDAIHSVAYGHWRLKEKQYDYEVMMEPYQK